MLCRTGSPSRHKRARSRMRRASRGSPGGQKSTAIAPRRRSDRGWCLDLGANRFAQSLHIEAEGYRAEEDWFHLAPGGRKRIRLLPREGVDVSALPGGEISHIGSRRITRF